MEAVHLHSISKLVMDLEYFMLSRCPLCKVLDQRPISSLQIYNRTNCSELASSRTSLELLVPIKTLDHFYELFSGGQCFLNCCRFNFIKFLQVQSFCYMEETQMFPLPLLKG